LPGDHWKLSILCAGHKINWSGGISQEGIAGTQWIVLQSVENLCPEKPGNKAAVEWEAAEYAGNAGKAQ
jgi:hypothetical protein